METIWDWITVAVFAGLIVLLLQRSTAEQPRDSLWQYLIPAAGCAVTNYLGNEDNHVLAALLLAATIGYIFVVLKPIDFKPKA